MKKIKFIPLFLLGGGLIATSTMIATSCSNDYLNITIKMGCPIPNDTDNLDTSPQTVYVSNETGSTSTPVDKNSLYLPVTTVSLESFNLKAIASGDHGGSFDIPTNFTWSITPVAGNSLLPNDKGDKLADHIKIGTYKNGVVPATIKAENIVSATTNNVFLFWTHSDYADVEEGNIYDFVVTCSANSFTSNSLEIHLKFIQNPV